MDMLDIVNTSIGASIPLLILYVGYQLERRRIKTERQHEIRMQFDLKGKTLGPQEGYYILDLSAILHNKGLVRLVIDTLRIKILGIKQKQDIKLFEKNPKDETASLKEGTTNLIASFPEELVNSDMLQAINTNSEEKKKNAYFVEPGVQQRISYVARIPENISFILVRAQFEYAKNPEKQSEHSAQIILEMKPTEIENN